MRDLAAAVLLSAVAVGLLLARFAYADRLTYLFLGYNLVLAWLPLLVSSLAHFGRRHNPYLPAALFLPWLVLFPNAPYIVTDLIHLKARSPVPHWYDIGLLATFGFTGVFVGLVSLRQQADVVRQTLGLLPAWTMVATTALLSGFAIYIGRFLRFNSWDLVLDPLSLLTTLASVAATPRPWGVTLLFGTLIGVGFVAFEASRWEARTAPADRRAPSAAAASSR